MSATLCGKPNVAALASTTACGIDSWAKQSHMVVPSGAGLDKITGNTVRFVEASPGKDTLGIQVLKERAVAQWLIAAFALHAGNPKFNPYHKGFRQNRY